MINEIPVPTEHKQKILDALPGLIGGINEAFLAETGAKVAFVLIAFTDSSAIHGTNIHPAEDALLAIRAMAAGLDAQ